ncbi:hypothetical protein, unknown function [Leishmania donovani]|uniref:Uncharacterized protein n=1 Tax=Leishmania donovani TaxID=5661 RepID=E9BPP3_LEIDO|nr:hypothetical protein, unknown function [Leishmania donovani]AYU82289.1 hypothetical protein LdCL_330037800 [Leishmania donovani]CBZ37447.1 hypothetical protein, unknown function [Leishmania donovani]
MQSAHATTSQFTASQPSCETFGSHSALQGSTELQPQQPQSPSSKRGPVGSSTDSTTCTVPATDDNALGYALSDGCYVPLWEEVESPPSLRPLPQPLAVLRDTQSPTGSRSDPNDKAGPSSLSTVDDRMLFSSQRQGPGCVPDRHRRHSQALETPKDVDLQPWRITSTMTQHQKPSDTSSSSSSKTRETEASRKNSGVTAPPQLLRLEGSGRVSPRPREPSSIPLAASARQPTGGRLEPLGRAVSCDSAPAAPASSYPLRVGTSKTLDTTSFDRIVFTPAASAPTYFCDTSTESGAGTASFFLREPVLAKPSSLNVGQNVASGGSPRAAWPLSWRGAPGDCGRSTGDAPHADQALRSGEPMAQVCRSSSATRQSSSSVASDRGLLSPMRVSPQGPGMPAAGAAHHATSSRGGEVFSIHTLVSRIKNVDNFDYGLQALGFPVEDCRRVSKASAGMRGERSSGDFGSYLMVASNRSGVKDQGGHSPRNPAAKTGSTAGGGGSFAGASSLLPLTRRQSKLPLTSSGVRAAFPSASFGLSGVPPHSSKSASAAASSSTAQTSMSASLSKTLSRTMAPMAIGTERPVSTGDGLLSPAAPGALRTSAGAAAARPQLGGANEPSFTTSVIPAAAVATPPSESRSSIGSSDALVSASFRSIVLQSRRLPYKLDVVYGDLAHSSSNFTGNNSPCRSSAHGSSFKGPVAGRGGGVATGFSSTAKSWSATDQSERGDDGGALAVVEGEESDPLSAARRMPGSLGWTFGEDNFQDYEALVSLAVPPRSGSGSGSSSSSDGSFSFGESDLGLTLEEGTPTPRQLRRQGDGLGGGGSFTLEAPADGGVPLAKGTGRRSGRDRVWASGDYGSTPEGRRLPRRSRDTFFPFEDGSVNCSRGFSSLALSSFLRDAGPTNLKGMVWDSSSSVAPSNPVNSSAQDTSSPPSTSGRTAVMAREKGRMGGLSHPSLFQGISSTTAGTQTVPLAIVSATSIAVHTSTDSLEVPAQSSPLTIRGGASTSTTFEAVTGAARSNHQVPRPPMNVGSAAGLAHQNKVGQVAASGPDGVSSSNGTAEAPAELVRAGVLRWSKPLQAARMNRNTVSPSHGATTARSARRTQDELPASELELPRPKEWLDVRGLTVLECCGAAATNTPATARVFAVDGGYTVRVVQGNLVGDCKTDECVQRCAAAMAAANEANAPDKASVAASSPPLPSLLIDTAVTRFIEGGENAMVIVMDTVNDFVQRRRAAAAAAAVSLQDSMRGGGGSSPSSSLSPPAPSTHAEAFPTASVARAMCMRVAESFLSCKGVRAKTHPDCVADLKVAVALVPVSLQLNSPPTPRPTSTPTARASSPAEISPYAGERGVFYDVIYTACTRDTCCRPLEVATSPIFGACLNECQWHVVEDESDIAVVFELAQSLAGAARGRQQQCQGFLYIQFLHQCFIPDVAAARGADAATSPVCTQRRDSRHGDIVVSSFTITTSPYSSVVESILDQRADTPWPLLRYALGKGPCTVLAVVNVHEEDEEAAYPLSILQRLKSMQHPRPRCGSIRFYIAEQRNKISDLKWRLANITESRSETQATIKRLTVLISKLECGAKDAEDFLSDPKSAHVPVYVDARKAVPEVGGADPLVHTFSPTREAAPTCEAPQVLALVQHYSPVTGFASYSPRTVSSRPKETTARWLAATARTSPIDSTAPRTVSLTAQLSLTHSTRVQVGEITSLSEANTSELGWQRCATWRRLGERFRSGFNATVAVVQESAGENRAWSLRVVLELVRSVLKDSWGRVSNTPAKAGDDDQPRFSSRQVMRVAASVYHCSDSAVADLLRTSSTSRIATGTSVLGTVSFAPAKMAVRPLAGACAPVNVSSKPIASPGELETLLRGAVERLRAAQAAAEDAASHDGVQDALTRQCLLAPGYTVMSIELTQQVTGARRRSHASIDAEHSLNDSEDVYVSTLTVVNLGGHYALLSEAIRADTAAGDEHKDDPIAPYARRTAATIPATSSGAAPLTARALLARLLVHRRHMIVCAVALPAVPTPEAADQLLCTVRDFVKHVASQGATGATSLGSVRHFIAHLRDVLRVAEHRQGGVRYSLVSIRDAVKRAFAVLRDPRSVAFTFYPFTQEDAEALTLPASPLLVDRAAGESVSVREYGSSDTLTSGTVPTISGGGGRRAPTLSTAATENEGPRVPRAAARRATPMEATCPNGEAHGAFDCRAFGTAMSARTALLGNPATYYGICYDRKEDPPLLCRDVAMSLCRSAPRSRLCAPTTATPVTTTARTKVQHPSDIREKDEDKQVTVPSVVVLNAASTSSYVCRRGTWVSVPVPSTLPPVPAEPQYFSFGADELVRIKPTSIGMKSSRLMRAVSCVSRGRTAALLLSDTESCEATSSIAWLTLRTVIGGIFQSLSLKEVEGVQHCATMRAFLIEQDSKDVFADLLAPNLTSVHPRQPLTRLDYSPFCGPVPSETTAVPVKDLRDVNVALTSVLLGARLAHESATLTAAEQLQGCIVLHLTFHQYVPATAGVLADVVVSSLWCVHMGSSVGWMEALYKAPSTATGALLRYWLGGPCYTTAIAGFSRYVGVPAATWRALIDTQRRMSVIVLRMPRFGSVRAYMDYLSETVARCRKKAPAAAKLCGQLGSAVTVTGTSSVLAAASPRQKWKCDDSPQMVAGVADAVARVMVLLKEAQHMIDRSSDDGIAPTKQLGLLAHDEKMFAALDTV